MTPAQASAALAVSLCGVIGLMGFIAVGVVLARRGCVVPETVRPDDGEYE